MAIVFGVRDVGDDERELVTAEPRTVVAGDRMQEAFGNLARQPVSNGMAQSVIYILEAVDVEKNDPHPVAFIQGAAARVRNNMRFGSPVSMSWSLVRLAIDLIAQLLDQRARSRLALACATSIRKMKVIIVEGVFLLVSVERNDGSDWRLFAHDRGDDRIAVFAGDRVLAEAALLGAVVE